MPKHPDEINQLHESVKRKERQVDIAHKEGERSIGQNLALIGSLGWLIITPTVVGVYIGRWLDGRVGGGIFWTGAFIVLGVSLGAMMAWNRIKKEEK